MRENVSAGHVEWTRAELEGVSTRSCVDIDTRTRSRTDLGNSPTGFSGGAVLEELVVCDPWKMMMKSVC